jgi:transcriptional repressor NrdR
VIDSRASAPGDVIRRRRECESCARRFTTYERLDDMVPVIVKKDGRREPFDRQKVLAGLSRACEKRPVSREALDALVDAVERGLIDTGDKEVSARLIGERVMRELSVLDDIAYVRFASVYRSFRDISELRAEVERIDIAQREGRVS